MNVALYVASPVTVAISWSHPANVYVYWTSASLVGVAPLYSGSSPYSTSLVCNSVPSSLTNLIIYLLKVDENSAMYVTSPDTLSMAGFHTHFPFWTSQPDAIDFSE